MRYITYDDLKGDSQERFIVDSIADFEESPDVIESRVLGIVATLMGERYDCDLIFKDGAPIRNDLLIDIVVKMVLFRLFKRNGMRKVGLGSKEDNTWALEQLEKINNGRTKLAGLPKPAPAPVEDNGEPGGESLWGNISNRDYYI